MSERFEGQVALITGAARGQGRAHAVRLASEGADVIAVDLCGDLPTVHYDGATADELAHTAELVEKQGRRAVTHQVDVRDLPALTAAVDDGVARLGRLDIVVANAGINATVPLVEMTEEEWDATVDIDLTGVWKTCKAAVPHVLAGGRGGSLILISSAAAVIGSHNITHYAAAKAGVLGLMRSLANELGQDRIRVNSVLPSTVPTTMVHNPALWAKFAPHKENATADDLAEVMLTRHALPVPWLEPEDIAASVAFLASDEARYITGTALTVDAGLLIA